MRNILPALVAACVLVLCCNRSSGQGAALTSYQNYDFVPGSTVLFEDLFTDDQAGEFPSHWNIKSGQATLGMQDSNKAFLLTDGNYCVVQPLMKNNTYLAADFSVEYDVYGNAAYPLMILISNAGGDETMTVQVNQSEADWNGHLSAGDNSLSANMPASWSDNYREKWHHIALAFKNDQLKLYTDNARVLTVPHCGGIKPANVSCEGIGDQTNPIIFKNFRVAAGVQMYMLGQKFTDAKIITHGINFDVDKAAIKPESMGTLNMIVQIMKSNPDIKFEIDGHTDNTGTPAHNLALSQQRADAVKTQLAAMGINATRLTAKGYGDTKPISDNATLEGKANNRRVEFVKM